MCRQLICLISFVIPLSMILTNSAEAALVGWWKLDDGTGTVAIDSSGFGHDGTITNATWETGKYGSALDFDGSGYVDVPPESWATIDKQLTVAFWIYGDPALQPMSQTNFAAYQDPSNNEARLFSCHLPWSDSNVYFDTGGTSTSGGYDRISKAATPDEFSGQWNHWIFTKDADAGEMKIYHNGVLWHSGTGMNRPMTGVTGFTISGRPDHTEPYGGLMDDVRLYDHVLTEDEFLAVLEGAGAVYPYALGPVPANDTLHADTWVSLSWRPGGLAASHDVYFGENFDDVNDGTGDTFRGNQGDTYFVAGFPGFAYPEGLVNGTTYYWRIDEVNDTEPNSPWKGNIWSFLVPPKTAYEPVPAEGTGSVDLNVSLSWTPGFGAKLHYIVFGEDFDEVNNAASGTPNGPATYSPGSLKLAKTYYWRVDEFDGAATYKGEVWSFTTLGAVSGPNPADGDVDVKPSVVLSWNAGAVAASHEVYFGMDADAVANATTASPDYKGSKALGEESYDPGILTLNTAYYWRIDEVNSTSTDSPWAGNVWSFTTGDFFAIDDFEDYDADENQIWFAWHDGLGAGAPGTPGYIPGNGTGSAVGDETTASYTEETIVQGGDQSMPVAYDNNKQGYSNYSEVEYTLTGQRDWTAEGVTELSIWFRGFSGSVGSFVEGPTGTYTMTGSGADIWNNGPGVGEYYDEFHFAYKMLTGPGSIVAKVESVQNTNVWAKAAVMIRETLDGSSKHSLAAVTPGSGVAFQGRTEPGAASFNTALAGFTAPYWVKLERDVAGNFAAYHSANGSSWQLIQEGQATNIPMTSNVYIGLALTSHEVALTCEAVFSNVTMTGTVSGQWANQDIGISSNAAEPLYVAVSNTAGTPAVVVNDDPAAATTSTWTEWVIPLQALADQGINLTNVDKIAIGLGTKGNMTAPGGSGTMFFDDIRLYKPREAATE